MTSDASFNDFKSSSWEESSRTCTINANAHYMITYSSMGFNEMLQDYIVSVVRYSTPQKWTFNRKSDSTLQVFPVTASFQFAKLDPKEVADGATVAAEGV